MVEPSLEMCEAFIFTCQVCAKIHSRPDIAPFLRFKDVSEIAVKIKEPQFGRGNERDISEARRYFDELLTACQERILHTEEEE